MVALPRCPGCILAPSVSVRPPAPAAGRARQLSSAQGTEVLRLPQRAGARPLPTAPGTRVPRLLRRAGVLRCSRRLGPESPASCGGQVSVRYHRRLGPESLASRSLTVIDGAWDQSHSPLAAGRKPSLPSGPGARVPCHSRRGGRAGVRPPLPAPGTRVPRAHPAVATRGGPEPDRYRRHQGQCPCQRHRLATICPWRADCRGTAQVRGPWPPQPPLPPSESGRPEVGSSSRHTRPEVLR